MTLLPEFQQQLRGRALELRNARHARRRRWRHHGLVSFAVLGMFSAVSGATAALGLWSPPLGHGDGRPGPVATTDAPSPALIGGIAALQRPQTEQDRRVAEQRNVLRYPSSPRAVVHTAGVRFMGTTPQGKDVVIVPTQQNGGREELCMWVGTATEHGGTTCAPSEQALAGGLVLGVGAALDPTAEERAAAGRRALAKARREGRDSDGAYLEAQAMLPATLHIVGVAPDGARTATIAGQTVPVKDNLFFATADERDAGELTATFGG